MGFSIHRFRALADLTAAEARFLEELGGPPVRHRRGATIRPEGQKRPGIFLMIEGWVTSSVGLPDGGRAIQKVHLPGDMLGTPSMILEEAADTLTAFTDAATASVRDEEMQAMFRHHPRLTGLFLMAVQAERLALMDTLMTTAKASARSNLARLLVDLHTRLTPLGLVEDDSFDFPLTQEVIGDMLGLTSVHVNRTVRAMREEGLIGQKGRRMILRDLAALKQISPVPARNFRFAPSWLPPAEA